MAKSKLDYVGIDNKKRIIEAATELFITKGAQETSLADIARHLNISKGTLYYYYSTKAELIFDVTDIYMEDLTTGLLEWVKELDSDSPPENILQVVFQTVFEAQTRGKLHIYLIQEAITNNPRLKQKIQQAYTRWKDMIREGLEDIYGDRYPAKEYAEILLTMLTGGIIHTILEVDMAPLKSLIHPLFH
jgi:TetR/AcrR family acrAB operon transcriptional repressor